jgi:hypothetical protein
MRWQRCTMPVDASVARPISQERMMAEASSGPGKLTIGSLIPGANRLAPDEIEGEGWTVADGVAAPDSAVLGYNGAGVERLTYNNPYGQTMERVWWDGRIVYAVDLGQVDLDVARVKVAQEYQPVYSAELDESGHAASPPEMVEGQLNIYDSVPGMEKYSPLWQFNYVIVPRSYVPNTLRSERDCLQSGYPILKSADVEN